MEFKRLSKARQHLIAVVSVCVIAALCYLLPASAGYRVIALILLVTVSLLAMFLDIFPVLVAAILSALIWNFFFIEPRFTLHIDNTEDALMFLMYFVIAMVNAALTFKIRQIEKQALEKEEKEKTLRLYNALLNSLSHELRTPISTIIGATDNLQANASKLSTTNKEELLDQISIASLRLNVQVENLLNMSRIESGMLRLKKDWCDVNELIYDTLNHCKEDLMHHHLKTHIASNLPLFKLDYGLLQTVLINILRNAAFYTPAGSIITIAAYKYQKTRGHMVEDNNGDVALEKETAEDTLIITIEDSGKGFPETEVTKVFDKFYRLENSKTGGTGLGLSIVKGFVEAHDGNVRLENVKGSGARFSIEIPAETSYLNSLKNE